METWQNIVHTAMIGTDKKMTAANEMHAALQPYAEKVLQKEAIDKEEKFLQLASLASNFRQAGIIPMRKAEVAITVAAAEERPYCSLASMQVLHDIVREESVPLLSLWLQYCADANQVVEPALLPVLLDYGASNKSLQTLVPLCCGKRGEWLSQFNEAWQFSANQTKEDLWETGTPEQRKSVLREIRLRDPDRGREMLQQTWSQEDANTKLAFLEIISIGIAESDVEFLSGLANEKSKKVKEEAIFLLKKIPSSSIVQQYQSILQQAVQLKKEKTLLGLTSNIVLHFNPPVVEDAVFKTGIEKLSSDKKISDEAFIIYQLMQFVPPSFWETHFDTTAENIINIFGKDETGKKLIPALVNAITNFNDARWAKEMAAHGETFYLSLMPLLSEEQQSFVSNKFFDEQPDQFIAFAAQQTKEWDIDLVKKIFKHASKNPYQYSKSFFHQIIYLIPAGIENDLGEFIPTEDYYKTMWSNISEYIIKLLHLKTQVKKSFKA